jgi:hypothetical protein
VPFVLVAIVMVLAALLVVSAAFFSPSLALKLVEGSFR